MIDLLDRKAFLYEDDDPLGKKMRTEAIPEAYREQAEEYRHKLEEAIVETDDALMEKYLAGELVFTVEELKAALRRAVCSGKIIPVLCGSAFKNKGVQPMLDAIIDYLPSPEDVKAIKGFTPSGEEASREPDENAPFSALAFKVMNDPFVGKLTFLRVYSGKLEAGSYVMNSVKGKRERISRLVQLQADQRTDVQEVFAGDIVAAVGLKDTTTGDTLCADSAPIILEVDELPRASYLGRYRTEDQG